MWREFFLDNDWRAWSWTGVAVIGLGTWYQVQLDVQINDWFGGFYDLVQKALGHGGVPENEITGFLFSFSRIAGIYVVVAVLLGFFTKHWTFRWRQAMNDHFLRHWHTLRHVEGASQRVQEDTRRFAIMVESIGASFLQSVMTLVAFLPILWDLSKSIQTLPGLGRVQHSMVILTIVWALLGTVLLALIGARLPGLEYQNQLVEAAYRKELVYGEDRADRAAKPVTDELFQAVRDSYFRLFFNFMYFDVAKWSYLQFGVIVPYFVLAPSIARGDITLGKMQRIVSAFSSVERSFQFLVRNWSTIVDLMSVYKRLNEFGAQISEEVSDSSETEHHPEFHATELKQLQGPLLS